MQLIRAWIKRPIRAPRFDGIYNDANLTGSLMALAVLVGLYLIRYRTETVGADLRLAF